jgi:hypothetical protein
MSHSPAERWTLRTACSLAIALVACSVLWLLDPRALDNGDPVWLKPMRFSLAFGVHLLTMAWIARLVTDANEPVDRAFQAGLWLQIAAALVEWVCISWQAARGVHSHFNYATPFDHAVFTIMGWGTAVLLAGMLLCGWGVARSRAEPLMKLLLLGALALAVLGALAGVVMVMPTAEQREWLAQGQRLSWIGGTTVGTPAGPSLPFLHWDRVSGDWRAVHFVGLHALQALPLLAWLARRAVHWPPAGGWARAGAAAYAALFAAVLAWTLRGQSVAATAASGWWWLATPGLLWLGSAVVIAWAKASGRRV